MSNQAYRFTVFITFFLLASVYLFVFSGSGILERIAVEKRISSLIEEVAKAVEQEQDLQREYDSYRDGNIKPEDIYDAGFIKNGERVILFKGIEKREKEEEVRPGIKRSILDISTFRIAWGLVSGIVLVLLFIFRPKEEEYR